MERPERVTAVVTLVALSGCTMIGAAELERGDRPPAAIASDGSGSRVEGPDRPAPEGPARYGNMDEYEQGGRTYRVLDTSKGYDERGVASWYGEKFHGRRTSSGEPFDMHQLSAAHRTLPLPSWVRVTNLANGRAILLRVNDRGPFADPDERILDVSYAAAVELGMVETGTAAVRVEAVEPWQNR